jgi:hypothetical protein
VFSSFCFVVAHEQVTAIVPVKDYKLAKMVAEKTWSVDI